ncbi:hypothetical protein QYE76_001722 [Lolium multiflorum]|uniref:Uncharacterized protein n=1 Tax=Lolium multiflorum TaxID=4521 RepID=A0AAD8VXL8_LOLMU|nr:hypothetical protein QYE76_001722 [Lolium multiflorum]
MMPQAGRLTLIRAVLAAIPLHQLMVLALNKKTLRQINKILRGFLWVGRAEANGGHCHVNWARVCRPLHLGGLGIPDLARMAISLRVRWLWRMHTDPQRPWRGLDMQFSKAELDIFAASTSMTLGNGESALFWEDRWLDGRSIKEMAPEVFALVPKRRRKVRTVRQALVDRTWIPDIAGAPSPLALWQYVQLWDNLVRGPFVDSIHLGASGFGGGLRGVVVTGGADRSPASCAKPSVPSLLNDIKTEAQQWARAGARGVRHILP